MFTPNWEHFDDSLKVPFLLLSREVKNGFLTSIEVTLSNISPFSTEPWLWEKKSNSNSHKKKQKIPMVGSGDPCLFLGQQKAFFFFRGAFAVQSSGILFGMSYRCLMFAWFWQVLPVKWWCINCIWKDIVLSFRTENLDCSPCYAKTSFCFVQIVVTTYILYQSFTEMAINPKAGSKHI